MSTAISKEKHRRASFSGKRPSLPLSYEDEDLCPYSPEQLQAVQKEGVPRHVAIVMDGNRRWAQEKGLPVAAGYLAGAATVTTIVEAAQALKIQTLTVYAFSTENWQRPQEEVEAVFALIEDYLLGQKEKMKAQGVRLSAIGNLESLPPSLQRVIAEVHEYTAKGESLSLIIALNYGGRNEICRAAQRITKEVLAGHLTTEQIDEEVFASYLDTGALDLDLLIRSGGQMRLSNFLLWQVSYAEVVVREALWPDFDAASLLEAVLDYQGRRRHYGA